MPHVWHILQNFRSGCSDPFLVDFRKSDTWMVLQHIFSYGSPSLPHLQKSWRLITWYLKSKSCQDGSAGRVTTTRVSLCSFTCLHVMAIQNNGAPLGWGGWRSHSLHIQTLWMLVNAYVRCTYTHDIFCTLIFSYTNTKTYTSSAARGGAGSFKR